MKLRDLYKLPEVTQGPTSNGWHQIAPLLDCYMEYKLKVVVGARTPLLATPDPLAKGSLFHAGREWWFNNKFKTGASAWAKLKAAVEAHAAAAHPVIQDRAVKDALGYLEQYCAHWGARPLPKPVGVEYDLGPIPLKPGQPWWLDRTARLDDVSYYPEVYDSKGQPRLCIGECKTSSVGVDDVENEYTLHGQLLMQSILWRAAPQGEAQHGPVSHVMLDAVKKGYGNDKCTFARMPVQVTHYSQQWFVKSMEYHLLQAMRIGEFTNVPRNPKRCTRSIGRMRVPCEFRDLCRFGDNAASKYVLKDGTSLSSKYKDSKEKPWD